MWRVLSAAAVVMLLEGSALASGVEITGEGMAPIAPAAVSVLKDEDKSLAIDQIVSPAGRQRFQPRTEKHLLFGTTSAAI
jgi:hypothetical protein